uniref:Dolichyl-diphosphooligosaccharide-protein glycosyltransferase subunit TMEM258 n=1 Tax=Steinernema glaseri TaxID=37863 RepID=A0A1I8ATK7_9BILA
MEAAKFVPYYAPVSEASFPGCAGFFLVLGLLFMAYFLVVEVTSSKKDRNVVKEFLLAVTAAGFLGFGTVFMMLWVGIYI